MITKTSIMAKPIIAWSAASPSSPAPSARRYAALGLDRSLQPSKLADHALRCRILDGHDEPQSTFTEISYTNYLTIPGQPQTNKRKCGIQPAHQSLLTDVFRSRPLLCTMHSLTNFTFARVERDNRARCA